MRHWGHGCAIISIWQNFHYAVIIRAVANTPATGHRSGFPRGPPAQRHREKMFKQSRFICKGLARCYCQGADVKTLS
uniref:Secreted protein n=1 Tax=Anguilla anguilla TaxID=7936 RepID=A0A0E9XTX0_ANGAN